MQHIDAIILLAAALVSLTILAAALIISRSLAMTHRVAVVKPIPAFLNRAAGGASTATVTGTGTPGGGHVYPAPGKQGGVGGSAGSPR